MKIFISYRRDDARGTAGRLYDRLADHYGDENVFRDIDDMIKGEDFSLQVEQQISSCDVLVVLIGPDWFTLTDVDGNVRIEQPDDLLRKEVEQGLTTPGMRVIPVLINGATQPIEDNLPQSLSSLSFRDGLEVRETRFEDDVDFLIRRGVGGPSIADTHRRRRMALLATMAAIVVAASIPLGRNYLTNGVEPLEGGFNVAVAGFGSTEGSDVTDAARLSEVAFSSISVALEDLESPDLITDIDVGGPEEIGPIAHGDADTRAAQAHDIAQRFEADVVFYGTLDSSRGVTTFVAEIFLWPEYNLRNAQELAGPYEMAVIELPTTERVAVDRAVAEVLQSQARAVASLIVGMSRYSVGDWDEAETHLTHANESWFSPEASAETETGREVILHLLGNVSGQQGSDSFDDAQRFYADALALNPDFIRSRFGLTEVRFIVACASEGSQPDEVELQDIADEFRAIAASETPSHSDLDVRSEFEVGRVLLCMSAAGYDHLEEARTMLEGIAARYEDNNTAITDLASESHQALGLYHVLRSDYEKALSEYKLAIDLSFDATRKAAFHAARGDVYLCFLNDPEMAQREYDAANALVESPPPQGNC